MALKDTPPAEPTIETVELEPGFYVKAGSTTSGPYSTAADAEAFIAGQLAPQDIAGEVVEV